MYSKALRVVATFASLAVVLAEPPTSYGPPGYSAPAPISTGGLRTPGSRGSSGFPGSSGSIGSPGLSGSIGSSGFPGSSGSSDVSGPRRGASGISRNFGPGGRYDGAEGGEPEPFNYAYEVKDADSGNDFSSVANSDGKRVEGEYRVLLPDGRRQIVKYTADDAGYNADVQYEGQARFPAPTPYNGPLAVPSGSGTGFNSGSPSAPGFGSGSPGTRGTLVTPNTAGSRGSPVGSGVSGSPIVSAPRAPSSPVFNSGSPSVRGPTQSPIVVGPTSGPSRSSGFSGYRY